MYNSKREGNSVESALTLFWQFPEITFTYFFPTFCSSENPVLLARRERWGMCSNNFQMSWNSRFLVLNKTAWYDQKCAQWRICQIFATFAIFAIFVKIATFQGAPVKISLNFRLIFGKFSAQSPFSPKLPLFKGPLRTSLNFLQTFGEFSPKFPFSLLLTFLNIWLHVSRGTAFLSKAKIQLFCIVTFGWPT